MRALLGCLDLFLVPPLTTSLLPSHNVLDLLLFSFEIPALFVHSMLALCTKANWEVQNNKDQLIHSLRTHRVNTITELRRIEKIFAYLDSAEVTEPMTTAWAHYVNSNNLLNELRGLTRTYPFSSECLDEAKSLVVRDPSSVRSWNYCWLVLVKMERE